MKMKFYQMMLIVLVTLIICLPVYADFPINQGNNWQTECAIVYNTTNHEYLVVWQENIKYGVDWYLMGSILGQRVKADGSKIGSPFTIISGSSADPAVAYNESKNEYFVVATSLGEIVGQRVSNTGALAGSLNSLMANVGYPRILYNSLSHDYLLLGAWLYETQFSDICGIKIYSRKIGSNGQASGSMKLLTDQGHGTCSDGPRYAVAYAPIASSETPNGRYLLVVDIPSDLTMLNSDGNPMATTHNPQSGTSEYGVPFQNSKIGIPYNIDVAFGYWNNEPVFFVVWGDGNYSWPNYPNWSGIIGGVVDANKVQYLTTEGVSNVTMPVSWIAEHFNTPAHAKTWRPKVAYNSSAQKFMVVWRETANTHQLNDAKVTHIRANVVDSYQVPSPQNTIISTTTGSENPERPAIAASLLNPEALVV
jgi:hypothetical protein